jgi:hypothetical protein
LKIHHALKETSYLTDTDSIAGSGRIATSIGNYLLAARRADDCPRPTIADKMISQRLFTKPAQASKMHLPAEKLKFRRPVNLHQYKIMGDKSPKSNQKKSSQKQSKASSVSAQKSAAVAAKSAAGKKK